MCVFQNPVSNLTMTVVDLHLFTLMFRKIVGQKKIPKNEQVNRGSFFFGKWAGDMQEFDSKREFKKTKQ